MKEMSNKMMRAVLAAVCGLAAGGAFADDRAASLPDIFPAGAAVLFIGDSVTHGGRAGDMNHHLGHGYQAEVAMRYMAYRPDLQVVFANRGVSGDTSSNVVARLKTDAFPFTVREGGFCGMMGTHKTVYVPDVASVLVGINDIQLKAPRFVSAEDYERNLRTILDAGYAANPKIRFVLCEPFKVCHPGKDEAWGRGADFLRYQGIVARLANEKGIPCVFFQRLCNETLIPAFGRTRYWFWDSAHPTYAAHMRMADFWIASVADAVERPTANPALRPQPPKYEADPAWYEGFAARVAAAKTADVVRLGGGEWARERTENLLWALGHGLLDGAVATRVVVEVGEGNRAPGAGGERACTEAEIAEARAEIVRRVREKLPKAVVELVTKEGTQRRKPKSASRHHEDIVWSVSYAFGCLSRPDLPRVLLVGDSICNGYKDGVRERLKDVANVTYWASSYCVTSPGYLELLDFYLDEAKYDVIHFNNGLHSLDADVAEWERALEEALRLIRRKQPDAKVVWATSTPLRVAGMTAKAKALNEAAQRVLARLGGGIATDDLFAAMDPLDRATEWSDDFHFRAPARDRQSGLVAEACRRALAERPHDDDGEGD